MRDAAQASRDQTIDGSRGDPALLIRLAWSSRWQSRSQSIAYVRQAKVLLKGLHDEKSRMHRALADVALAWQAKWRGDFDDAIGFALRAEQDLPESDFPAQRAEINSIMGVVHYSRHRLDLADAAVQRGFKLVTAETAPDAFVDLLTTSAAIHRYCGDLRTAGEVLGKARRLASGAMLARVEHNVARWMQHDDAPRHALDHAETSIKLAIEHQNNVILPYAHEVAGACQADLDHFDHAVAHFKKALHLATKDKDSRAQCQVIGWFAALESKRASFERARDLYCYGTEIAKKMNYILWEQRFARGLADVYEELGDLAKSVECHKRAWKLEEEKRQ